ncbi:hypothetical protein LTR85_008611 [Meristemomyces frigidus]|nr:hypothetical protein LTR85_008611 [Meristemomyces frigidus]
MDAKVLMSHLPGIDRASFGDDESARMQTLLEARALVERLEKPWEKVDRMVWLQPTLLLTVKIASDMGLFAALSSTPQNSEQLGKATNADPILVSRLLRMLAAGSVVEEVDVDAYIESEFSRSLRDRHGLVSGVHHFWDVGVQRTEKLPDYLRRTGYTNPSDAAHPPFESFTGTASYWEWHRSHSEAHANFNSFLSSIRVGQPPWPSYYPVSQLLEGHDGSGPLCVDVGGGKGRDLKHLADAVHDDKARLVLQDLQPVIDEAKREQLPPQIELLPHNFFDAQPCKGARAYFMHSILHDWPDAEGTKILLLEAVMPERIKDVKPRMAALDINMMANFAALERTEKQWRSLLEAAGLQCAKFWELKGGSQGIIEVDI